MRDLCVPEITFFMIVTPRDVVIADYAVRSYAKIRDLDFTLLVYSNYLLPEQKAYYFPRWEGLPFVQIARFKAATPPFRCSRSNLRIAPRHPTSPR